LNGKDQKNNKKIKKNHKKIIKKKVIKQNKFKKNQKKKPIQRPKIQNNLNKLLQILNTNLQNKKTLMVSLTIIK
jgi:hypothetical protein